MAAIYDNTDNRCGAPFLCHMWVAPDTGRLLGWQKMRDQGPIL
jgi:hypothetical protein